MNPDSGAYVWKPCSCALRSHMVRAMEQEPRYPGETSRVHTVRYELMNLMNLFRDSADVTCICRGGAFRQSTKQSNKPATGGSKFISSFKKVVRYCFKSKSVFLLIKRLKNDEFMNINELTWGLFPSFAKGLMNLQILNELRVLQVHCKFIRSS